MSRDYDEYCIACKGGNARSMFITENKGKSYFLYQCLDCGTCFVEIRFFNILKTKADYTKKRNDNSKSNYDEEIWKKATSEVYELNNNDGE